MDAFPPVDGREIVCREGVLGDGAVDGRTPDNDARDCIKRRMAPPSPGPSRMGEWVPGIVTTAAFWRSSGSGGTGGGVASRDCRYLSRKPPVLIRFTSFHHFPPACASSSSSLSLAFSDLDRCELGESSPTSSRIERSFSWPARVVRIDRCVDPCVAVSSVDMRIGLLGIEVRPSYGRQLSVLE